MIKVKTFPQLIHLKQNGTTKKVSSMDLLNEFLEENDVEYIDLKFVNSETIMLIYKEKEEK